MGLLKNKFFLIAVLLIVVLAAGIFGYVSFKKYQEDQAVLALQMEMQQKKEQALQEYEDLLNNFVKEFAAEAVEYKKQRKVLREVIRPHNFETPEFAKQSYEAFINQVEPGLRRQAVKVMNVFDLSGAKLDLILEEKPQETQDFLRAKWDTMKSEQSAEYIDYFEKEEHVLKAYENLIRFYFVKSKSYQIKQEKFVFSNPSDVKKEEELLKTIESLQPMEKNAATEETKTTPNEEEQDFSQPPDSDDSLVLPKN